MESRDVVECFACQAAPGTERHHIFYGIANRRKSEEHGLVVDLCPTCHRGTFGVHGTFGRELNMALKTYGQHKFEETHTREEFIREFGKSYL